MVIILYLIYQTYGCLLVLPKKQRSGAMSSRIAMLNIIDILYICIASNDYLSNRQKLENTRKAIKIINSNRGVF